MEEELANFSLLDDEEEAFQEEAVAMERTYQFCLVGHCLTDSVVHFPSLRNAMADLWHPIGGICITDLGKNGIFSNSFMRLTLLGYLLEHCDSLITICLYFKESQIEKILQRWSYILWSFGYKSTNYLQG
ncbi:hypothetical protein Goshw_002689 [Gossypium schwendimanii]|uniref:DUF4283 domain-containing protein n=1 Tax=Gossypium schwendimanii TaxID=34291 RepID=A0A7J9LL55_GOSSC|nr:hypothetical protein [Gossypium schwendimanii]